MAEEQSGAAGQVPAANEPQAGTVAGQEPDESKNSGAQLTPEQLQAELDRVRGEAAANRKGKAEAEAKVKEFEDREKTETQKLSDKISQLEKDLTSRDTQIQELRVRNAFMAEATKPEAGVRNPGAAFRHLDLSRVEYDDAGEPKNLGALVESLKGEVPEFFEPTSPGTVTQGAQSRTKPQSADDQFAKAVLDKLA